MALRPGKETKESLGRRIGAAAFLAVFVGLSGFHAARMGARFAVFLSFHAASAFFAGRSWLGRISGE